MKRGKGMSFASIIYFVFFAIIAALLGLTNIQGVRERRDISRVRHILLLIASYIFYGAWDWRFCFLMLFVTLSAYIAAIELNGKYRKISLCLGVIIPLLVLGLFKYYNFFMESFFRLFQVRNYQRLQFILPVGISFYTFQALSYVIDVDRKKLECEKDFIHVALYISFFPQLVAGPIVKAKEFLPQLKENRNINIKNLEIGIQIFVMGLFKKIVLADWLSVFVDEVFATPSLFSGKTVLLAIISYSLQIYFDFSGYSDMAIGSAKCLGYDLNRNFNLPYISKNVTEFWKRWHISLSTWLQEYVYIPLGGNRKGTGRTYLNLLLTMALGGLWHGAAWSFVVWGLLHGVALCVYKIILKKKIRIFKRDNVLISMGKMIMTYCFVSFCWVFFRASGIKEAFVILKQCLVWNSGVEHLYFWSFVALISLVIATGIAMLRSFRTGEKVCNGCYIVMNLNTVGALVVFFVVIGITIGIAYTGSNPFVYFQF